MKTEVVQTLCPGSTGNYDITGTTPNGDMVGAIFISAQTTTDNTNVPSLRWGLGATDLTNNIGISIGAQDATAGAGIRSMLSNTNCLFTANGIGGQSNPIAAYNSTLTNGVRLTTSVVTVNRLTETLLISGTDSAMKVGSQLFGTADTSKVITHGLGGTPDVIILLCSFGQSVNEGDGTGVAVGFWDRTTAAMSGVSFRATTGANPTDIAAYASTAKAGQILAAASSSADITVTSVGSTTFTITLSSAADATNKYFGWIALRGTVLQMFSKNALVTLPTSTGNTALISGMTGHPQAFLLIPTRLVTSNSVLTDDTAGSFGSCIAVTNDYANTTVGGNASTFQDNVAASSVAKTMLTNTLANLVVDNAGNADIQATVNSWDIGGVTLNYTNAGASAFQAAVLAFGLPLAAGARSNYFARQRRD